MCVCVCVTDCERMCVCGSYTDLTNNKSVTGVH